MRFVAVKSAEQQAVLMLHKSRHLMVRQRTMLFNALRGHLAEYGIVTGIGAGGVTAMLKALHERQEELKLDFQSRYSGSSATAVVAFERKPASLLLDRAAVDGARCRNETGDLRRRHFKPRQS